MNSFVENTCKSVQIACIDPASEEIFAQKKHLLLGISPSQEPASKSIIAKYFFKKRNRKPA